MVIANFMPRYGTQEHKRLGLLLLAVLAVSIIMLLPDLAFAAGFNGTAKPATEVGSNLDSSFRAWWKFFATPLFWASMFWLIVSVFFFSGRGWMIPVVTGAIFLFGEMIVDGFKSWMGG